MSAARQYKTLIDFSAIFARIILCDMIPAVVRKFQAVRIIFKVTGNL